MAAEGSSRSLVRLNAVDRRGRKIEPAVLAAAEEIYPKALDHGLKWAKCKLKIICLNPSRWPNG